MRLINTETFEMQEFFDDKVPKYAILSHRWEDKEVSYRDFRRYRAEIASSDNKIQRFCSLSRDTYCCEWAWVDTCCIDQKSSAELSEAINSMYRWYSDAKICLAYLSDVDALATLKDSAWFTRGWTLQELLAPEKVDFYNGSWDFIGTRTDLAELISSVTGIRVPLLSYFGSLSVFSREKAVRQSCIAEKMSWASKRVTSRKEDIAYCLMGLFDVNMPLLYGEGHKAFYRLQQEIIKESDDESIFAWSEPYGVPTGFFADSPQDFLHSSIEPLWVVLPGLESLNARKPYQITNQGLQFEGHVLPFSEIHDICTSEYGIPIKCRSSTEASDPYPLVLPVRKRNTFKGKHEFIRDGDILELDEGEWRRLLQDQNAGNGNYRPDLSRFPKEEIYLVLRRQQ